jgi:hypothetical protein
VATSWGTFPAMFLSMGWLLRVALRPRPPYPVGELVEVTVDLRHVVVEAAANPP